MIAGWSQRLVLTGYLAASALATACSDAGGDRTQLVVLVSSDYVAAKELTHVEVSVTGAERTVSNRWRVLAADADVGASSSETQLPFSFGIRPPNGDPQARVELSVTAFARSDEVLVRRQARVGFVAGQRRLLRIDLTHDCAPLHADCALADERPAQTCSHGRCAPIDVDVHQLEQVRPGAELADAGTLPPWCDDACADGGSVDARDASALADASDSGSGSARDCGAQTGFFADVGRKLTQTADGTLCPLIAHTYFDDSANNAEQSRRSAVDEVGLALDADFDVVELTVAQRGSTLYAVGMNASSEQPSLVSVLQATALRDADQPLKLVVSDDLPGASEFAHALLELLISAEGAPYLGECRPLYLVASSRAALEALLATRTLLASDAAYARLRGHLHFGAYESNAATGSLARSALADLAAEGFELVELDHSREGLLVAVAQARALGLQVILRDVDGYYVAPLCGLVAGLGTMKHVTTAPTPLRKYIRGSQRLLELNVAGAQPGATQLRYLGRAQDGELSSPLDERTPTLSTGDSAAPLAGTFLHFDGAAQQSLVLHDASLPAGFTRFAAIASLRLSSTALAPGERQVIASTRSAMSGWSLELVNDLGTTELRFETWIEEVSGGPVHYSASIPASSLATAGAQTALFGTTTYVELQTGPLMSAAGPFISDSAPIESGEAVTLGVAPNQTTGYFDGDLQLLKLVAY